MVNTLLIKIFGCLSVRLINQYTSYCTCEVRKR